MDTRWLRAFFGLPDRRPKEQRRVDVGRALITVETLYDQVHKVQVEGVYRGVHPLDGKDWIRSAEDKVDDWFERNAKIHMVSVGSGEFVQEAQVKRINVKFYEHWVNV